MAAPAVQNPSAPTESKSARKKRAKVDRTESPAPAASTPEKTPSIPPNEGGSDEVESPYVRELSKNIRNIAKRLANVQKIDTIVAEHKDKTIEELVAQRIINGDQKAAYLAKGSLKSQHAQLEEQLAQYKKVDQEYRGRAASDRAELEKTLTDKYEKEKSDAVAEVKAKADADAKKILHGGLLVVSQFLRLAAARRAEDSNPEADENLALEGVLLQVYTGDENAVGTMIKLVQGSDEQTRSVSGEALQTTYAQVQSAAVAHSAPLFQTELPAETTEASDNKPLVQTDPTVAHAGLTEIADGTPVALTNARPADASSTTHAPTNADVADSAANAAGESQWDAGNSLSMSQEWVEVPREAAETETGLQATPAAPGNTQSWADDQPENPPEVPTPADPNEGFHQVQRHRGRGNHEGGGYRGRGQRGRGGYRGDGRGRGRGGRGGGGAFRGRREES